MFGLGVGEILLVLIVALLVFGPTKLPDMARTFGKAMAEFKRASKDLRETFEVEMHRMDQAAPTAQARPEPKILEAEIEPIHRAATVSPEQTVARPPAAEAVAVAGTVPRQPQAPEAAPASPPQDGQAGNG